MFQFDETLVIEALGGLGYGRTGGRTRALGPLRNARVCLTLNAQDTSLIEQLRPINKNAGRVSFAAFPIAWIRHLSAKPFLASFSAAAHVLAARRMSVRPSRSTQLDRDIGIPDLRLRRNTEEPP